MKEGPRSIHRLAAPIKGLAQRFAFMALVLAAFALMLAMNAWRRAYLPGSRTEARIKKLMLSGGAK